MGLFSDNDKAARAELKQARKAMGDATRRRDEDGYYEAARRVDQAERKLPAWKRVDIDHLVD